MHKAENSQNETNKDNLTSIQEAIIDNKLSIIQKEKIVDRLSKKTKKKSIFAKQRLHFQENLWYARKRRNNK